MKKIIALTSVVVLVLSIVAACLAGCFLFKTISLDEAKTNLENAGYEVTVMSGDRYVEREDAFSTIMAHELDHYLYAVKGEDEIHIFFFATVDYASDNMNFMQYDHLSGGQNNEVVYFGTKQAKADAGL